MIRVVVNYGTSHFDVTEDKYREDDCQPPFEELPWKPGVRSPGFGPDIVIAYREDALFVACWANSWGSSNSESIVFHIDKAQLVKV